jgi:hypothetical protein
MKFLKRLLVVISLVLFMSSNGAALDLTWEHDNPSNVTGYTIYYGPIDESEGPYNITVIGGSVMTVSISGNHFKPNLEYTIHATAYNLTGQSEPSESIVYKRTGWGPPDNLAPVKLYIKPGKPKNLLH